MNLNNQLIDNSNIKCTVCGLIRSRTYPPCSCGSNHYSELKIRNNFYDTISTDTGSQTFTSDICTNTITLTIPDPLIDWLPYHYKKYLPTWHLVRSYQHE